MRRLIPAFKLQRRLTDERCRLTINVIAVMYPREVAVLARKKIRYQQDRQHHAD
jgi:hypothetical protein